MAQLTDDCFAFGGRLMSVDDALALIAERLPVLAGIETVPLHEADGRVAAEDVTANAAEVARRWHDARKRQRTALVAREGEVNFAGLQRFLLCVHTLSVERRLSRLAYLAEKPAG